MIIIMAVQEHAQGEALQSDVSALKLTCDSQSRQLKSQDEQLNTLTQACALLRSANDEKDAHIEELQQHVVRTQQALAEALNTIASLQARSESVQDCELPRADTPRGNTDQLSICTLEGMILVDSHVDELISSIAHHQLANRLIEARAAVSEARVSSLLTELDEARAANQKQPTVNAKTQCALIQSDINDECALMKEKVCVSSFIEY